MLRAANKLFNVSAPFNYPYCLMYERGAEDYYGKIIPKCCLDFYRNESPEYRMNKPK